MSAAEFTVTAVGVVANGRTDPQDTDHWGPVESTILIDERFGERSLLGLEEFSHVEILYVFDRFEERADYREPRSGRGRADLPAIGIFSERGPRRPNRIGATVCRVLSARGRELHVQGLDAIDGTPVLDIKPVMRTFVPTGVRQPAWVDELMSAYL